jgi:hypothetical protein
MLSAVGGRRRRVEWNRRGKMECDAPDESFYSHLLASLQFQGFWELVSVAHVVSASTAWLARTFNVGRSNFFVSSGHGPLSGSLFVFTKWLTKSSFLHNIFYGFLLEWLVHVHRISLVS